ncbi:DUF7848 domain-containing protein [Streptomyces rimosus]|uniref:DUF7848 domain-containing protein n=1 Tax=Streptomyces rimosus TaxID=1927 RepID=UPI000AC5EA4B|nr:hypothetical protein [Streptomyces rimosus]
MSGHPNRLMCSCGRDGVLLVRTGDAAGVAGAVPPTRLEIQISGIRKHVAECVTEIDGSVCGARSSVWDAPMQANTWMREHAADTGHKQFEKRMEEPVSIFSRPARERSQ